MPNVFFLTKSSRAEDARDGVATFGASMFSRPDLIASYYQAADLLLSEARKQELVSDLGLPIFYLQRHTAELILKKLYDVAKTLDVEIEAIAVNDDEWDGWTSCGHDVATSSAATQSTSQRRCARWIRAPRTPSYRANYHRLGSTRSFTSMSVHSQHSELPARTFMKQMGAQ